MRRDRSRSDSRQFDDWIDKAESDLNAAMVLMEYSDNYDMVAFHCQQTIEKALKGYLLFKKTGGFDGHNLTFLCRQAAKFNSGFRKWMGITAELNLYYIQTRYPADQPLEVDEQEAQRLCRTAREMFLFIDEEMDK